MSEESRKQQSKRDATLMAVIAYHGEPETGCEPPATLPRWLGLEKDHHGDVWFSFTDYQNQMLEGWASDDSDYEPHQLIDLDSGRGYSVNVKYDAGKFMQEYEPDTEPADWKETASFLNDCDLDVICQALEDRGIYLEDHGRKDLTPEEVADAQSRLEEVIRKLRLIQPQETSDSSSALPGA